MRAVEDFIMKRKVVSVLLCAAMAFSLLAGCGSGSSDSGSASGDGQDNASDMEYVKDKGTLVVGITNCEPMD